MYLSKLPKVKQEKEHVTSSTVITPSLLRRQQFGPRDAVVFSVKKTITQKSTIPESIVKEYVENLKVIQDLQYLNPQMLSLCYIISKDFLDEGEIMSNINYAPKVKAYFSLPDRLEQVIRIIYDIKITDQIDIKRYQENIVRYFIILTENRCL